jgi:hypothetical protein
MMNWEGCERERSWPHFNFISHILRKGIEENHEKLSQDSRSPVCYENPVTWSSEVSFMIT